MLKKLITVLLFPLYLVAQPYAGDNYWQYHQWIAQAENAFFVDNNADSCLYYYDLAFDNFEFNYVNDLLNAAQISFYTSKNRFPYYPKHNYEYYLHKGVKYGLRSKHLAFIPMWAESEVLKDFQVYENSEEGKQRHRYYLHSISTDYLCQIYDLCIADQKMVLVEYENSENNPYKDSLLVWDMKYQQLVQKYGFPGQKILGIDDNQLFDELGISCLDFKSKVFRDSAALTRIIGDRPLTSVMPNGDTIYIEFDHIDTILYEMNTNRLTQGLLESFYVHQDSMYAYIEKYAIEEIEKGNLHPRLYAFMYDTYLSKNPLFCLEKNMAIFFVDRSVGVSSLASIIPDDRINGLRKKFCICSLEADRAKIRFAEDQGCVFRWGHTQYL